MKNFGGTPEFINLDKQITTASSPSYRYGQSKYVVEMLKV
jgi:hypothetical protein